MGCSEPLSIPIKMNDSHSSSFITLATSPISEWIHLPTFWIELKPTLVHSSSLMTSQESSLTYLRIWKQQSVWTLLERVFEFSGNDIQIHRSLSCLDAHYFLVSILVRRDETLFKCLSCFRKKAAACTVDDPMKADLPGMYQLATWVHGHEIERPDLSKLDFPTLPFLYIDPMATIEDKQEENIHEKDEKKDVYQYWRDHEKQIDQGFNHSLNEPWKQIQTRSSKLLWFHRPLCRFWYSKSTSILSTPFYAHTQWISESTSTLYKSISQLLLSSLSDTSNSFTNMYTLLLTTSHTHTQWIETFKGLYPFLSIHSQTITDGKDTFPLSDSSYSLTHTLDSFQSTSPSHHLWIIHIDAHIPIHEKRNLYTHLQQSRPWYRILSEHVNEWNLFVQTPSPPTPHYHFYGLDHIHKIDSLNKMFMKVGITNDLWTIARLQESTKQWMTRIELFINLKEERKIEIDQIKDERNKSMILTEQ